ncbi:MAG TPA: hypothetical protein DCS82_07330 [Rhodospirillaceae bacterium]|nr:hypothetical protein [Rhodospirillaceae bacterium]
METLGITAATFTRQEIPVSKKMFEQADFVLAMPGTTIPGVKRVHVMTPSWLDGNMGALPQRADFVMDAEYPVRIIQGSGTTGEPKAMIVTAQAQEYRLREKMTQIDLGQRSRTIHEMPFNVAGEFFTATACLRAGGACIWDPARSLTEAIEHHKATHGTLIIGSLMQSLARLPDDYKKPKKFSIRTFGGPLTEDLRNQALDRLADNVVALYGANELPGVAYLDPDGTGHIRPEVQVEILDEDGNPAVGVAGEIRLKAPYMVNGYINDPAAYKEKFRDGWFYPGDYGVMPEPGKLKILGRSDDLLNLNGVKFHPSGIESRLAQTDGISELCVTVLEGDERNNRVCICVVLEPGHDVSKIVPALNASLPPIMSDAFIVGVNELPKTANGKIRRRELKEMLKDAVLAAAKDEQ